MSQTPGIPIGEFVGLLEKAQRAYDANDLKAMLEVNERIQSVGYSIVVREGQLHLKNDRATEED